MRNKFKELELEFNTRVIYKQFCQAKSERLYPRLDNHCFIVMVMLVMMHRDHKGWPKSNVSKFQAYCSASDPQIFTGEYQESSWYVVCSKGISF